MNSLFSQEAPEERINLAKVATAFAVAFGIAFGLCTVSTFSLNSGGSMAGIFQFLIGLSLITEAVCAIGLLTIGVMAVVRRLGS
jgi:hypothetical protein